MHYAYERGSMPKEKGRGYDIAYEVRRLNGKSQSLDYKVATPMQAWMMNSEASAVVVDTAARPCLRHLRPTMPGTSGPEPGSAHAPGLYNPGADGAAGVYP